MSAYERLLLPENLNYAWLKAKQLYHIADGYIDNGELSEFELDLERRLKLIHEQFKDGSYQLKELRPLPRPKKMKEDQPIDRQYYHVAIEDQVAWIAVANALGPELDQLMPPWSYGNRIYRPAWYEDTENQRSKLEIGPYRHASGHLYRKFQHSWPLFRRQVALTAQAMVRAESHVFSELGELDQGDELALAAAAADKLSYLQRGFWHDSNEKREGTNLYHASIDLKQFYPSIRSTSILEGFIFSGAVSRQSDPMLGLLNDMLDFKLDLSEIGQPTLENVEPLFGKGDVDGIPTGLFVAGFLANTAMLSVDSVVEARIQRERSLAHFRFVDDHTILAYNFNDLCDWITWYQELLTAHSTGATVNKEKYDPLSLSEWMEVRTSITSANDESKKKLEIAVRDTKIDGANPIKLLTKTLGQVSAIAAANIDILDDADCMERLKFLEWLLLADIPEREIRPDTRAAFAAGQIAKLAPILIHEVDGLVDEVRSLAHLSNKKLKLGKAGREEISELNTAIARQRAQIKPLAEMHERREEHHLKHCFGLLFQAFQEYPGKARLFYRLHQYCRLTGYKGLVDISRWLKDMRDQKRVVWADYYAGLSLQILSGGILQSARTILSTDALRSDKVAAYSHLNDISQLNTNSYLIPNRREAWFHATARREFGVSLLSVAQIIQNLEGYSALSSRLKKMSLKYVGVTFDDKSKKWRAATGRSPGVWAHRSESALSIAESPSSIWASFESCFFYGRFPDRRAARRYPEILSSRGWNSFLRSEKIIMDEDDSGWLRDAMKNEPGRIKAAKESEKKPFVRAAKSFEEPKGDWITLSEWTQFTREKCSPFDPRMSEWTALEIVRQIIVPILQDLDVGQGILDLIHPNNVLVNRSWTSEFPPDPARAAMSWEQWRSFVHENESHHRCVKLRSLSTSIFDYRYSTKIYNGQVLDPWRRRLVAVGRLLLGLLCCDHNAPRLWNFRGNEHVKMFPLTKLFQSLAISSPTLLLLESCLSSRSAESRTLSIVPGLFGLAEDGKANDVRFDPPLLSSPNALSNAVENAQRVLVENQLAVAMNQPRQLIPFRLSDFAAGPGDEGKGGGTDE